MDISNWIVSIFQASSAAITGIYIVYVCSNEDGGSDVVYGCRCKYVEVYLWVLWSYYVSDTFRLYSIHQLKFSEMKSQPKHSFFKQGKIFYIHCFPQWLFIFVL